MSELTAYANWRIVAMNVVRTLREQAREIMSIAEVLKQKAEEIERRPTMTKPLMLEYELRDIIRQTIVQLENARSAIAKGKGRK